MSGLNEEQKKTLLGIAKRTVESFVREGKVLECAVEDEYLKRQMGAFVTLHLRGNLKGCIGQILPNENPLWEVVREMAIAACSDDDRFSPVTEDELEDLEYEISVLSEPVLIDDWRKINLGVDGVVVKKDVRTGVFLPQVAEETGWTKEEFLRHLCSDKAGLKPDAFKNDPQARIFVFTAQVIPSPPTPLLKERGV
jgi:AmmeMemoRadiSam system protein A